MSNEDDFIPASEAVETSVVWPIILFAFVVIGAILAIVVGFNKQDPYQAGVIYSKDNCGVCPMGPSGTSGPSGRPGNPGRQGDPGPSGPQGPTGGTGASGPAGMCLASPLCLSGPSGPKGDKGDKGDTGDPGLIGATGPSGSSGPSGGTGPSGPSGPSGDQGPMGFNGTDAICQCFNISSIQFDEVNATTQFNLGDNSRFTCGINSTIDVNCLVVGNCPNFSQCSLQMMNLEVFGGNAVGSMLRVGNPLDIFPGFAFLGDSSISNYFLNTIKAYAGNVIIEGNAMGFGGQTVVRSRNGGTLSLQAIGIGGTVAVNSVGSVSIVAQTGNIGMLSSVGIFQMFNSDPTNPLYLLSAGDVIMETTTSSFLRLRADNFVLQKLTPPTQNWFQTNPLWTYAYNIYPLTFNFNDTSHFFFQDIILANSTALISQDQYLKLGPGADIGTGQIVTLSNEFLRLQLGTFSGSSISMEGPVSNEANLPLASSISTTCNITDGFLEFADSNGYHFGGGNVVIDGQLCVGGGISGTFSNFTVDAIVPSPSPYLTVLGEVQASKYVSYSTPTCLAGPGAGTGSCSISSGSSDCKMRISLTVSGSPSSGDTTVFSVSFGSAFSSNSVGTVFSAADGAASGVTGLYVTSETASGFSFNLFTGTLSAGTYAWNFNSC